jgi:hypothetical protein
MFAGAAWGAGPALAHTSTFDPVCGLVLFLGVVFLYGWCKARR